jgi:hypothetical protein
MKFRQWKWVFAVFLIAGAVFLMKPQAALAAEADDHAVNAQTPTAAVTETVP